MFVAGVLAMGGTASGFQAKPNQSDAAKVQVPTKSQMDKRKDISVQKKKLSETRIAELKSFAKTHHPEMTPLLEFLREKAA